MRVYHGEGASSVLYDAIEFGADLNDNDELAEALRDAHEDARAVIADCDYVADQIEAGKVPDWIIELREECAKEEAEEAEEEASNV